MATVTTNYGLTKPAPEDFYDIGVHNSNMEIIDAELKRVASAVESGSSAVKNHGMIAQKTNLNDLTEVGFYHVNSNEWAMSLLNCPTTTAFFLEVGEHAGVYQRIVEFATEAPKIYFRNYYSFTNTWSEWFREYTTADKPTTADVGAAPNGLVHAVVEANTNEEITSVMLEWIASMPDRHVRHYILNVSALGLSLDGGTWFLVINKASSTHASIIATRYDVSGIMVQACSLNGGTLTNWNFIFPVAVVPATVE